VGVEGVAVKLLCTQMKAFKRAHEPLVGVEEVVAKLLCTQQERKQNTYNREDLPRH